LVSKHSGSFFPCETRRPCSIPIYVDCTDNSRGVRQQRAVRPKTARHQGSRETRNQASPVLSIEDCVAGGQDDGGEGGYSIHEGCRQARQERDEDEGRSVDQEEDQQHLGVVGSLGVCIFTKRVRMGPAVWLCDGRDKELRVMFLGASVSTW